jgi:hypothetical protein
MVTTMSSRAARDAADRWLMTVARLGVGFATGDRAVRLRRRVGSGRGSVAWRRSGWRCRHPAAGAEPTPAVTARGAFVALAGWPACWQGREDDGSDFAADVRPASEVFWRFATLPIDEAAQCKDDEATRRKDDEATRRENNEAASREDNKTARGQRNGAAKYS